MSVQPTAVNGRIPEDQLGTLPGRDGDGTPHRGHHLAAASHARLSLAMVAAGLGPLLPTDGFSCYRTLADQQYMRDRGLTKVPVGKSIHGEALAFDFQGIPFGSARHQWMRANAGRYGFYHPYWARQGGPLPEHWHWEYDQATDMFRNTPPPLEDDEVSYTDADRNLAESTYALLQQVPTRVANVQVSRVAGHPTTWLQDDVNGTTAALSTEQRLTALEGEVAGFRDETAATLARIIAAMTDPS